MSKYIKLENLKWHSPDESLAKPLIEFYITESDIADLPTIDIVRCKDCKHKRLYDGETKYFYCALEDRPNRNWSVDEWNFCWWGERKDNENE